MGSRLGPFTLTAHACHTAADCPTGSAGQFCSWPIVAASLPFDTIDFRGSLDASKRCGSPHALAVGGDDSVYAYTATNSGSITARVQGIGQMDPILIVTTDCASIATSCVARGRSHGRERNGDGDVHRAGRVTYYVMVDSYGQLQLTFRDP